MLPTLYLVVRQEQFEEIARGAIMEVLRIVDPYWDVRIARKNFARILVACGADRDKTLEFPWRGYVIKRIGRSAFIEMTELTPMSSASTLRVFAIPVVSTISTVL